MEAGYDISKKTPSFVAGAEYECCDKMKLKSKIDLGLNLSLAGKYKFTDYFTMKSALKVPIKEWKKFTYGFDWEVNM